MRIDIKGADILTRKLSGIKDLDFARKTIKKHGALLHKEVKKNATRGYIFTLKYSTGETKKSTSLAIKDNGLTAVVAPNTHYAIYVEYGTRKMNAKPFVRPALEAIKPNFLSDLEKMDK